MREAMKRAVDIAGALGALLLLSPLLLAVAALVRIRLGSPVLFAQPRAGLKGRVFILFKFRTMTEAHGGDGRLLPDSERLTRLGTLLRETSLDELPGFWNVLRGDMSLVGPRPLLPCYLERYTTFEARRHEVKAGLTGWAQVHGRNDTTWEERLRLDVWYVDNRGWRIDLRILARTVAHVLGRRGIRARGHATMPEFRPPGPGAPSKAGND